MSGQVNHAGKTALLENFLIQTAQGGGVEGLELPPLESLEQHHLLPYTYSQLPEGHPLKQHARTPFLQAAMKHEKMKRSLMPLLQQWHEAGIKVLVFKGFHLAEFVYDTPANRFYGDIDVLISPNDAALAEQLARRLKWRVVFSVGASLTPYIHELMHLRSPDGSVFLEVHQRIIQNYMPLVYSTQTRLTQAAWQSAHMLQLEGVPVFALQDTDALLMGLILNRSWSEDDTRLHAHDYLDMVSLLRRVSLEQVHTRARELGCERTLRRFLSRCNPAQEQLVLSHPSRAKRVWWNVLAGLERPLPLLERTLAKVLRLPGLLRDIIRELPGLLRVLKVLRQTEDVNKVLEQLTLPVTTPPVTRSQALPLKTRQQIVRGVKWGLTLMRVRLGANCLPRSLAIYVALRKRGVPAVFCSGMRRISGKLEGHAWVEVDGVVLDELHEPLNQQRYSINLRYPDEAA
ncbi:MAG: lasso peptide biosynthesis B2 protein [Deinococcota bacterium]